jgi:hypothetical protein
MTNNLTPAKAFHTSVNMLRLPHKGKLPVDYKIQDYFSNAKERQLDPFKKKENFSEFQTDTDILFDTFLENYNRYKNKEINVALDKKLELFGAPKAAQYKAFSDLINFSEKGELEFLNRNEYYFYDLTDKNYQELNAIFEFIENIVDFDFDLAKQEKKIVLSSGSFFKNYPEIRKRMVGLFQLLIDKGVKVELYTNCEEDEIAEQYDDFIKQVKKHSRFGLKNRIPIHFIQAGNDYYFIEFPHTEKTVIRLNMFLDINTIKYKKGKTKADVKLFFDNLILKAFDNDSKK